LAYFSAIRDYLWDPNSDEARQVRSILSDTTLVLESAFSSDVAALTAIRRAGWIQVNEVYDLLRETAVGNYFWSVYSQPLERGYSGDEDRVLPSHYIQVANPDLNLLERAVDGKNMGLIRMYCPGVSDIAVQKAFIHLAEQRAFEFREEVPAYVTRAAVAENWVLEQIGRNNFATAAFPSYGWEANPLGSGYRLVPLSGLIAGGESDYARANGGYHLIYAGIKATLPGILRVPISPDPADQEILNAAGIHPVIRQGGNYVVWGMDSPSQEALYEATHVRRIQSHYIRFFKEARNLLEQIFLPNQPGVADRILIVMDQFARSEYGKGVITNWLPFDQAVDVSTDISEQAAITEEDTRVSLIRLLEGHLDINFFYVPTGLVKFVNIHIGPQRLAERYGQFSSAA